jgi:ligand-binding SRPBCC domain-containing protein
MSRIVVETLIAAAPAVCFDLARDVEAHTRSAAFSRERVVGPGRTTGLLECGDVVTFEGVHFGIRQRFTARIVEMERPHRFVDELVKTAFSRMRHVHEFEEHPAGTLMRDTLDWTSPFGFLGIIADRVAVARHLQTFVTRKQLALKELAEGGNPPY